MAKEKTPKRARTEIPDDAPVAAVRVDEELHRALRVAARRNQVGATRMVNIILRRYLEAEGLIEVHKSD